MDDPKTEAVHFQAYASPSLHFPGPGRPPKQYSHRSHPAGLFPKITGVSSGPFNPAEFEMKSRPGSTSSASFGLYPESKEREKNLMSHAEQKNLLSQVERKSSITIIPLGHISDESAKRISHGKEAHKSGLSSSPTSSLTKDPPVRRFVHPAAATTIHEDFVDEQKVSQAYHLKREVAHSRRGESDSAYLPASEITLTDYDEEENRDLVDHEH